ncbi:T6SS immunity protein Tdi1 domain-containing protein [Paenibacillus brasilensis]|uniref:GAD-like domain protein n=1 Tax=Paenibacillus brasilensis TaxID=128574 RepID=A0ABU0L7B6_9BACL|nr:T6SS immunity protein Tdi1 domain-containing protein [Paenibacillus brasilensis]MDQ0497189.1 hypothetical protein [Paenibacillus brasilensis]
MMDIFSSDFIPYDKIEGKTITKYRGKVPDELLNIWEKFGAGSIKKGYLKLINPDDFIDVLNTSYFRSEISVPIFTTSMCDIITFEENKYLRLVKYRRGNFSIIPTSFNLFLSDLLDEAFCNRHLDWGQYEGAVEKLGVPTYTDGFGYVPLLGLGGAEKVENLQKVRVLEHIQLITEMMGAIE